MVGSGREDRTMTTSRRRTLSRVPPPRDVVPFVEAVKVWARVSALSFGGPAGQIAVMHRIVVDEKRWIGKHRFLHALNYCMLLPGPEAHQLAIYIGWLLNKTKGGIIAAVHAAGFSVHPGAQLHLRDLR
jgi:chromate transporter